MNDVDGLYCCLPWAEAPFRAPIRHLVYPMSCGPSEDRLRLKSWPAGMIWRRVRGRFLAPGVSFPLVPGNPREQSLVYGCELETCRRKGMTPLLAVDRSSRPTRIRSCWFCLPPPGFSAAEESAQGHQDTACGVVTCEPAWSSSRSQRRRSQTTYQSVCSA